MSISEFVGGGIEALTLLFEKNAAFGDDYGDVSVDVAVSLGIDQGDSDVCVLDALAQGHAEDASGRF